MAVELRPYQADAIEQLRRLIAAGKKNILLCAPTGAGKTIIASFMMQECAKKFKRVVFVVDRINLVDQTSAVLDDLGIEHGMMQADHWRWRPYERVQVCTAQTVSRRKWPDAHLNIVDECHTISNVVKKRIEPRDTITIGLTATPFTKGLGKLYDALVNVTTTNKLIEEGYLSKYRIFAASEPNMDGVKSVAGEWEEKEASKRAMEVAGDCLTEYMKHGNGKKFICSAVDVAHVEELQRQFMAAGVQCAAYTYKVSDDERAEIVKEFRKPDSWIRGLITVTAATKGFDVSDIEVVIMARPLRTSLAEHIQFFGRGLRSHPGKKECIVLDHSGNCLRFWNEWTEFFETGALELDDGKKKQPAKKKQQVEDKVVKCGNCKHLHTPKPFCPACGHEYPKHEAVKHVAGTLKELIASGDRMALNAELWPQIVGYALLTKEGEAARKYALALYKEITDQWPANNFYQTEPVPPTREVINKIKQGQCAYRADMKAHRERERVAT